MARPGMDRARRGPEIAGSSGGLPFRRARADRRSSPTDKALSWGAGGPTIVCPRPGVHPHPAGRLCAARVHRATHHSGAGQARRDLPWMDRTRGCQGSRPPRIKRGNPWGELPHRCAEAWRQATIWPARKPARTRRSVKTNATPLLASACQRTSAPPAEESGTIIPLPVHPRARLPERQVIGALGQAGIRSRYCATGCNTACVRPGRGWRKASKRPEERHTRPWRQGVAGLPSRPRAEWAGPVARPEPLARTPSLPSPRKGPEQRAAPREAANPTAARAT